MNKSDQGSEWELRGKKTGVLLHSGISEHRDAQFLRGATGSLKSIEVGQETETKIDGLTFRLVRVA